MRYTLTDDAGTRHAMVRCEDCDAKMVVALAEVRHWNLTDDRCFRCESEAAKRRLAAEDLDTCH